jgi:hypothetical protein
VLQVIGAGGPQCGHGTRAEFQVGIDARDRADRRQLFGGQCIETLQYAGGDGVCGLDLYWSAARAGQLDARFVQIIPECMIPFVTIIEEGEKPFAMFKDLWIKYKQWVFPPIEYASVEELLRGLDKGIIDPAQERFKELVIERAKEMPVRPMSKIISEAGP